MLPVNRDDFISSFLIEMLFIYLFLPPTSTDLFIFAPNLVPDPKKNQPVSHHQVQC